MEKAGKKKNGLMGGVGASKWAEREAKKRGKPKTYAAMLYAKVTGKK